jgi:hypothetical protein
MAVVAMGTKVQTILNSLPTSQSFAVMFPHGNCGKVCTTDSDFFGLSRSTSCECYSYQVSSIFVRRVTYYDHFCVFQFFSILAVSMVSSNFMKHRRNIHRSVWKLWRVDKIQNEVTMETEVPK